MQIEAGKVVTPNGVLGPSVVECESGIITSIRPASTAASTTLVPGFIDLQVNGIDDIDVAHASGDDWDRLDALLLAHGTTTWCPTLITAPLGFYTAALHRIALGAARPGTRPHIAGAHLEGPFLGSMPGAHPRRHIIEPDLEWIGALPPIVCMMTIGAESPASLAAISLLAERGVLASIGHSAPSELEALAAFHAGAAMVTHGFNAMGPLHHREPGLIGATLGHNSAAMSLIADFAHVAPSVLRLAARALGRDRLVLVTDAVAWRALRVGSVGITYDGVVPRLEDGTLAGSALTMDRAVANMLSLGIDLSDVIAGAAANPARLLGLADRGAIAIGLRADLVAVDSDGAVRATWVAGELCYAR